MTATLATEPNLEAATTEPCGGLWELFDSTNAADHADARVLCNTCPVIAACRERLADVQREFPGGVYGTWAGRLYPVQNDAGVCSSCERPVVRAKSGPVPDGAARYAASGLCQACYSRRRYRDKGRKDRRR